MKWQLQYYGWNLHMIYWHKKSLNITSTSFHLVAMTAHLARSFSLAFILEEYIPGYVGQKSCPWSLPLQSSKESGCDTVVLSLTWWKSRQRPNVNDMSMTPRDVLDWTFWWCSNMFVHHQISEDANSCCRPRRQQDVDVPQAGPR